jgi:hypothetical protein
MITCKMICVIQGILPSHYFCNVNLDNYELPHVLKVLHFSVLHPKEKYQVIKNLNIKKEQSFDIYMRSKQSNPMEIKQLPLLTTFCVR